MTLTETINEKAKIVEHITKLREGFKAREKELQNQYDELDCVETLLLSDINTDKIAIAEGIINTQGNVSNLCDGERIADLAARDIANGCKHLRTQFYGNKQYGGLYQRNDCEYGYGPKHGSIIERVELRAEYRQVNLTDEQREACIYYLKNFGKIYQTLEERLQSAKRI